MSLVRNSDIKCTAEMKDKIHSDRKLTLALVVWTETVASQTWSDAAAIRRRVGPFCHPEGLEGSVRKVWGGGGCGATNQEGR